MAPHFFSHDPSASQPSSSSSDWGHLMLMGRAWAGLRILRSYPSGGLTHILMFSILKHMR